MDTTIDPDPDTIASDATFAPQETSPHQTGVPPARTATSVSRGTNLLKNINIPNPKSQPTDQPTNQPCN
jgi:hypothetical protein